LFRWPKIRPSDGILAFALKLSLSSEEEEEEKKKKKKKKKKENTS
jgi:hypothetical protein